MNWTLLLDLLREFGNQDTLVGQIEAYVASQAAAEPAEGEEPAEVTPVDPEILAAIEAGLTALADEDEASAALLIAAADGVTVIRTDLAARQEAAAAEEAAIEEARAALRGEAPEGSEGGEGGEEAAPEEEPPAEGEPAPEGDEAPAEGEPAEAVAAATRPTPRRALARRQHRPPSVDRSDEADAAVATIVAAADIPGVRAGEALSDLHAVDAALASRYEAFRRTAMPQGIREQVVVASIASEYPEERTLRGNVIDDSRKIEDALAMIGGQVREQGVDAVVAAGGFCGILTPIRTVQTLGSAVRPIRDTALLGFGLNDQSGAGVVSMPSPTLPEFVLDGTGAVGWWTALNDADPNNAGASGVPAADRFATKPCLRVECDDTDSTMLEAITLCLEFGNFLARSNRPRANAYSALGLIAHARLAEVRLWNALVAKSTTVAATAIKVSATRDVLDAISRLIYNVSSRHRDDAMTFRIILPAVLREIMRTDIARGLPGADPLANLRLADAQIVGFFRDRRTNVTWSPDLNVAANIADGGALTAWPATVQAVIYPEGTHLFLDGGVLDLGVVRDSSLNSTNDYQTFMESMEATHQIGPESHHLTITVCPSGATVGAMSPTGFC